MPQPPEGFRYHTPIQVRWGDMDALGHVNNALYLTYMEQARVGYFSALNLWDGSADGLGLIMARVELDFKLPLFATDDVHVYTRCSRLGTRSFDTEQMITRRKADDMLEVVARAKIVIVVYDYATNTTAPIPDTWRQALHAFEPVPIVDEKK